MKRIYFVTEGPTDKIVVEGLIAHWLAGEDFISRQVQPPSSAYTEGLDTNLSTGWKGVRDWCEGKRSGGPAGRDETLGQADCLIIHVDADVATDTDFKTPSFAGPCPPAQNACDWIRDHLTSLLGGILPPNVVLCIPSQDLEAWVLCALHPDIADTNLPIECKEQPGTLLVSRSPHQLLRRKDGKLRKDTRKYASSLSSIVSGWSHCTTGALPRCPEAIRFETDIKMLLEG